MTPIRNRKTLYLLLYLILAIIISLWLVLQNLLLPSLDERPHI